MKLKVIISSIILIFFFSGLSIGKEFNKTSIQGESEIAKPILKVEDGETININKTNKKGTYNFKVKNYDEKEQITQVDLEYYIEILSKINKNINFKIYRDDQEININENKTEKFLITKDAKQEDNYRIEVECNSNTSAEKIIQKIQIKVRSEQRKE